MGFLWPLNRSKSETLKPFTEQIHIILATPFMKAANPSYPAWSQAEQTFFAKRLTVITLTLEVPLWQYNKSYGSFIYKNTTEASPRA